MSSGSEGPHGGECKLESNRTQDLFVEMEKLLDRTSNDLMSVLVNVSGSPKAIDSGTLIKIPTDAGYVKLFKSPDSTLISLWLSNNLMDTNPTSDLLKTTTGTKKNK